MDYEAMLAKAMLDMEGVEPMDDAKVRALRGQQALGVLGAMGGRNVGRFADALYTGASRGIEDERQAYNDRVAQSNQGLNQTKRMLEGKRLLQELRAAERPETGKWNIKDVDGRAYRYNDLTGEGGFVGAGGGVGADGMPLEPQWTYQPDEIVDFGKLRESDATSVLYAKSAAPAIGKIRTLLDKGFEPSARDALLYQTGGIGISGYAANKMASPESQAFVTDAKNLVAALLRRESGAAINAEEWAQGRQRWIPMPGDSPELVQAKLDNAEWQARAIASTLPVKANRYLQGWISHHGQGGGGGDGIIDLGDD